MVWYTDGILILRLRVTVTNISADHYFTFSSVCRIYMSARLYYSLTEKGQKQLHDMSQKWTSIAQGVAAVLGGKYVPEPSG